LPMVLTSSLLRQVGRVLFGVPREFRFSCGPLPTPKIHIDAAPAASSLI